MTSRADVAAVAVDTCVLVEATDAARVHHRVALELLELHPTLMLPAQVVREYLVAVTRPTDVNGLGLSLDQARENLEAFRANLLLLPEERPVLPAFWRLLHAAPCLGKRLHDAHLAATALTHRIREIVTLNGAHFVGFAPHVSPITPAAALARL